MDGSNATSVASNSPATDQRKYQRYVVAFPAFVDDGVIVQASTVIDISREGCRIRCRETTPGAKYFRIDIHLAGPNETLAIDLAVMRWSRDNDIGVEFIIMSPAAQERLRAVIRSCEEAAARPEHDTKREKHPSAVQT
ncbi:MAG: hypothetical protein EWM72_02928 [Nitrospira sp.]|nr:MAG: hypothetical protein EWM72_02928 [Nitrospira sp.]